MDNFNAHWPFILNAIIGILDLGEIVFLGRQFTLANRKEVLTYEKLDRILASMEWEKKNPLVSIIALPRSGSDHTPLLLDSGDQAFMIAKRFFFEL